MLDVLVVMTSVNSVKVLEVLLTSSLIILVSQRVLMECMAYLILSPVWFALVVVKLALELHFLNVILAKTMGQNISSTMVLLFVIPLVQMVSTQTTLLSSV